jgi:hypothetical protein
VKKSILNTSAFRYIFEIIVIVFSVTLSFYIQDVLNDREKLELKNISLKGVSSDLEKDIINFNYAIDLGRKRISNIDTILNPKYDLSSKTVNAGAKRYFGFLGNNSNYKSMVSSGALEFIGDSNLFELLNRYYSSHYDIMMDMSDQDENNYNQMIEFLSNNYLSSTGDLFVIKNTKADLYNKIDSLYPVTYDQKSLKRMKSDRVFVSRVNHQKSTARINVNLFLRAINVNEELQVLIQKEINN